MSAFSPFGGALSDADEGVLMAVSRPSLVAHRRLIARGDNPRHALPPIRRRRRCRRSHAHGAGPPRERVLAAARRDPARDGTNLQAGREALRRRPAAARRNRAQRIAARPQPASGRVLRRQLRRLLRRPGPAVRGAILRPGVAALSRRRRRKRPSPRVRPPGRLRHGRALCRRARADDPLVTRTARAGRLQRRPGQRAPARGRAAVECGS
jgi:hypothetical protein